MKIAPPEVTSIEPVGVWRQRNSVNVVFIRRHNLQENLAEVQNQTREHRISLNTDDWLFLLEGRKKYLAAENQYLDTFVDGFNISAYDPIVDPFTEEIANAASMEKPLAALSVLVMEYLDYIDQNAESIDEEKLREFLDEKIHILARCFDVSFSSLQSQFLKLKWNTQTFWDEVEMLRNKKQRLINESNTQSKNKLLGILSENEHPNIFIMSGVAHKPVFVD